MAAEYILSPGDKITIGGVTVTVMWLSRSRGEFAVECAEAVVTRAKEEIGGMSFPKESNRE